MNELARLVHDLVTGKPVDLNGFANLSPEERAALDDLQALLSRQPVSAAVDFRTASDLVANDWASPSPSITPTRS